MDTTAKEIVFTDTGCNFCDTARKSLQEAEENKKELFKLLAKIEESGKGKDYDVLIGLSGGVDSSLVLHHCLEFGLKPLCFSVDNGWNDPKADENIMRLVEGLKVPFYRYTIDLKKFMELQGAFMQAGVKNIEIPTDHILMATSLELASKYGIKYIFSGGNVATESIMPASWGHNARDLTHIKAIYKRFTNKRLKGLPLCSIWKWNYYRWIKKIKTVYLLDYLHYDRQKSIELLEREYGYKPYGDKHYESIFTWWFQAFYLFQKFGIDKRKAHLSSLIASKQITREEALKEMEKNPEYPQIGLEQRVLKYEHHEHEEYPTDRWYSRIAKLIRTLKCVF